MPLVIILTSQRQSEYNQFAHNAEENADEVDTSLSRSPLKDDRFATCGLLTIIDLLGGSEEQQQLTERLKETAAGYGVEVTPPPDPLPRQKQNLRPRPFTNIRPISEWKSVRLLGSTQTKDEKSSKGVKIRLAQTHSAMTRICGRPYYGKTKPPVFHIKIKPQITRFVNAGHWM